jgi:hypothetical protein
MSTSENKNTVEITYVLETTGEEVATIVFTSDEFDEIELKAAELGVTVEDYFREVIDTYSKLNL